MSNPCPCNGCKPPKRHPACHGHCSEHAEWKAKELKKKRAMRIAKSNEHMTTDYIIKQMRACKREKNITEHRAARYKN